MYSDNEHNDMAVSLTVDQLMNLMTQAVEQAIIKSPAEQAGLAEWMSVREASEYSRLAESTVRQAIRLGKLPARRRGRRVLIKRVELAAWLDRGY